MDVQFTEQPAERLVLVERQFLVAEEDHLMRHERIVHLLELLVAQRPAEIDTGDLRADCRGGRLNLDGFVGHGWRSSRFVGDYPSEATSLSSSDD
jgi:hypothetical protein